MRRNFHLISLRVKIFTFFCILLRIHFKNKKIYVYNSSQNFGQLSLWIDPLCNGVIPLHDISRQYTVEQPRNVLPQFNWETFDHPPCNLDLAPRNFHVSRNEVALGWASFHHLRKPSHCWQTVRKFYASGLDKLGSTLW
jgi:hypothetical protein